MDTLQVLDGSDEVRVEICGKLSGSVLKQLQELWEASQTDLFWRRFVVNISAMTGYEIDGHEFLHRLHRFGAIFCAATPQSLDYLDEISSGILHRTKPLTIRRPVDRTPSTRPKHRAGIGTYEVARYR
jgi:hypothetical protein